MIRKKNNVYKIDTPNTSLVFLVNNGSAEYVYYGKRLKNSDSDYAILTQTGMNTHLNLISTFCGDEKITPSTVCLMPDGGFTQRFKLKKVSITTKPQISPLPSAYTDSAEANTLLFEFVEESGALKYNVYYTVYEDSDVICVNACLINSCQKDVYIQNIASLQYETYGENFEFTTFQGEWGDERNKVSVPVNGGGSVVNCSVIGSTSHNSNPFVMLSNENSVYGFNILYSGNHKELAVRDSYGKTRVSIGINDFMFNYKLSAGETFFAPEAVMTFGSNADEMSVRMHDFVNTHIVRGKWRDKERPVVINNWEATYFNFNKEKIVALAEKANDLGIELLVLDDGWFGHRVKDDSSLGDWFDFTERTGGIAELAESVREKGLKFGIWMEPEMISEDSVLYSKHPEFTMKIPGRTPKRMRNQLMLNLADPKVQKYVIRAISNVLTETKASYLKWDYNRFMSDCFGRDIPQGEYFHRYMLGLYTVMGKISEKFPSVLMEGCAGGGGRYDLGILCYFPQIWTSDDCDARMRLHIQQGTSYGYSQRTMSCHIPCSPNHTTRNRTPLETRFNVNAFGAFGYELDLTKLTENESETVKKQVAFYKKWRKVFQQGTLYRLGDAFSDNVSGFISVSKDGQKAVAMASVQEKKHARYCYRLCLKGLEPDAQYEIRYREQDNYDMKESFVMNGELLMSLGLPLAGIFDDKSEEGTANPLYTRMIYLKKIKK